ncbi:MAG: hypothetical protein EBQ80_01300 [Proteobacteria bacterium]|nr:hypothetical protein [Pseudomonadota bacterium]
MMMRDLDGEAGLALLAKVKGWFEEAVTSAAYSAWRSEARQAWDFYDGSQWTAEEVERLGEHGQAAIVINRIGSKIDNLTGGEVNGRTRVVYRSRSGVAAEEEMARVLTDVGLFVAERGEQGVELSQMFKASLVAGIGWLDVGVEEGHEGPQIFTRAEDEMAVVWDPLSRRFDLSDARFVARERWLDEAGVKQLFAERGKKVLGRLQRQSGSNMGGGVLLSDPLTVAYTDSEQQMFRVVEVQFKEAVKQWRVRLADGRLMATFDKAEAESDGVAVEEVVEIPRVMVAYFSGDVLLDVRPLAYQHNDFTLVPMVYKRHRADGRPYGLVRSAIDPQRELNKRRSKAMHLLNTAQVIADIDAVEDPNILAREAARPDGMILKRPGKDLRIIRNSDLAASQVGVMEQAGRDIQEVMGVFDETLGKASNAVSGVAITQRQLASSLTQMLVFDNFRLAKKKMARQVLGLIRQYFDHEMLVAISDRLAAGEAFGEVGARKAKLLPETLDWRSVVFDVVVEEVRDVLSSRELEAQRLAELVKAGVPVPPELLVEASGVRGKERILAGLSGDRVTG